MTGSLGVAVVVALLGVPLGAFVLWPLLRRHRGERTLLALPAEPREQLLDQKRQVVRALRELEFEFQAGLLAPDDYEDLRRRYEAEAAAVLAALDRLGPAPPPERPPAAPRTGWRHPLAVTTVAAALVVFGIALGAGIARYTEPAPPEMGPPPGSRPLARLEGEPPSGPPSGASAPVPALSPETLRGMLEAARASLVQGRYSEAIAAYQAVLRRDPQNVDALTHLGLIVALGGHTDAALESFERALRIDPDYPPALLYRGQVLLEAKRDVEGAVRSWERFLQVVPAGADHDRVKRLIAEARARR
jgi:cytochrome c-type biogenesis protein CcmH/NrfG